jgi:hypothetical protein
MYLGEQLQEQESLSHEFKEFCLKNGVFNYYDYDEITNIISSGILPNDFNQIILDNLKTYFLHYVPKYASAFSNCKIDKGVISIGINDFGELTGIPYIGILDIKILEEYLQDTFKYIRGNYTNRNCKRDYIQNIKLEIMELDISDTQNRLYDISDTIIENMERQKKEYNKQYIDYLSSRNKWMKTFSTYACNVNQLVNGKRDEIIEYIRINVQDIIDIDTVTRILDRVKNETPIETDNIDEYKDDKNHHLYWIFQFKDESVYNLLESKPKPPCMPKILNAPYTLITQLSDMRAKFIENNKNLRYYLIRIHFSGSLAKNKYLEYYHPFKSSWQARCRVQHPLFGPCCLVK